MLSAIFNISIHIEHIDGKLNVIADLLSIFKFDQQSWELLNTYVCSSPADHQSVCPASGCIETCDSDNLWQDVG